MDLTKCHYVKSQRKCRGPALAVNSTLRNFLMELRSGFCPQLLDTEKDEAAREKMNQGEHFLVFIFVIFR